MKNEISIGQIVNQIFEVLSQVTPEERFKILSAINALFGDSRPQIKKAEHSISSDIEMDRQNDVRDLPNEPIKFFEQKNPQSKGEELAVSARFRELSLNQDTHSREDFIQVFKLARRYFDSNNFKRDMDNAQRKSKLFLPSLARGTYQLSAFGQKYVDTLPTRELLGELKIPRKKINKKQSNKKKNEE